MQKKVCIKTELYLIKLFAMKVQINNTDTSIHVYLN